VVKEVHDHPNRRGYAMNAFVIAVGGGVKELTALALETARKIGKVECDMGDTYCKLPSAVEYIQKIKAKGRIGVKRKSCKC
jgi:hypothetical protein